MPAEYTDAPTGETARVVPSVPKSATFCFGWNGYTFFLVANELVAVKR